MSNIKLTREQLKALTATERLEYNKKMNAERVKKYRDANADKAKTYNKEYKKDYINRPENKAKYEKLNREYVKKHRVIQKEKLGEIESKVKATNTLSDAIKARKARAEMKSLKASTANKDVKDILDSVIDAIPKQADLKQKREYMTRYRAKKRAEKK